MPHRPNNPQQEGLRVYSLGLKLKALRAERGLTLAQLGAGVELSTALLSKLESDRMVPTLPTLLRISQAYGVGLSYFFSDPTAHSIAITRNVLGEDGARTPLRIKRTPLHALRADAKQISELIDIPVSVTAPLVASGAKSELTAYVLDGTLHLSSMGVTEVLQPGDCVVLDTDAVVLWSGGESSCRILAVFPRL